MKQPSGLGIVLIVWVLVLSACGSEVVSNMYTASGDATNPDELTATRSFQPDDDLNVVLELGSHNRELPVYAVFEAPTGDSYDTQVIEADAATAKVLLGLDWEGQEGALWPAGAWTVRVFVDDEQQESVTFTVVDGGGS